jgi:hypothetical protein
MHLNFLGNGGVERLWTTPLLYKLVPNDDARVVAQLLIGIACWSALAFAVAYSLTSRVLARVGAVLVLLLGLCAQVTEWDTILMSESLALSLLALLVASLLWLKLRPTRWRLIATLAVVVLWVFTKQFQATLLIPIAIVVITWILLRHRRLIVVAVALAAIAAWGGYATVASGKANMHFNANDIMVFRILKTPGGEAYFARRGMPMAALNKEEADVTFDTITWEDRLPVLTDPEWYEWIDSHWLTTYAGWLLRHPVTAIKAPLLDAPRTMSGFNGYADERPVLPGPIQDTIWNRDENSGELGFFAVLTFVLWLVSLRAPRRNNLDAWAAGMLAVTVVWYYAGWHLVPTELQRIETPAATALRLGLLILSLTAVDRLLSARQLDSPR